MYSLLSSIPSYLPKKNNFEEIQISTYFSRTLLINHNNVKKLANLFNNKMKNLFQFMKINIIKFKRINKIHKIKNF